MNLLWINEYIFFPHVYRRAGVEGSRSWVTDIARDLTGGEERRSLRLSGKRKFSFTVEPVDLQEWQMFEARVMRALKSGKACCPDWGKGIELLEDVTGDTVRLPLTSTYVWTEGDYIYFREPGKPGEDAWNVRQVESIDGNELILTDAVDRTFRAGSFCWPLFFGSFEVEDFSPATNHRGPVRVTFGEPVVVVPEPETSCNTIYPVILEMKSESCAGAATLSWNRSINAAKYRVLEADQSGGPYTQIALQTELEITRERHFLTPKFYVVQAIRGEIESEYSNEVEVPAITLERTMRAIQERYRQSKGLPNEPVDEFDTDFLFWPLRWSDGEFPGFFPPDNFYGADIFDIDGSVKLDALYSHIRNLADIFHQDGFLARFATTTDIEGRTTVHVHSVNAYGEVSRFADYQGDMPSITDDLEEDPEVLESALRTIISRCCQLNVIVFEAVQIQTMAKACSAVLGQWSDLYGTPEYDPEPAARNHNYACYMEAMRVGENKRLDVGGYNETRFHQGASCDDNVFRELDESPWMKVGGEAWHDFVYFDGYSSSSRAYFGYTAASLTVKGDVAFDLSHIRGDYAQCYYWLITGGREVKGKYYEPNRWQLAEDIEPPQLGVNWSAGGVLNSGQLIKVPNNIPFYQRWNLDEQMVIVVKSSRPADKHFDYYP